MEAFINSLIPYERRERGKMDGGVISNNFLTKEAAGLMLKFLNEELAADENDKLEKLKADICQQLVQKYGFKKGFYSSGHDGALSEDIFQETIEITLSETFLCKDFLLSVLGSSDPWELLRTAFLLNRLRARTNVFRFYTNNSHTPIGSTDAINDAQLYKSGIYFDPLKTVNIQAEIKGSLRERVKTLIRKTVSMSMCQLKNDYKKIIEYRSGMKGEILTYKEIEKKLHITESNARKKFHDAMRKLLAYCSENVGNLAIIERDDALRFLLLKYKEIIDERLIDKGIKRSIKQGSQSPRKTKEEESEGQILRINL
jgi:hypothetical protein